MKRFAVAVRRQYRGDAEVSLERALCAIEGVQILGIAGAHAQVEATDEAAVELRSRLGEAYIVEEVIERSVF